ncbi:YadA C-terminal domain-containing protein [Qipengyuania nanhaisediminis]|uniref:YadA C-terminal domain-containing protein n=1 Tax=Qipengyuania nanhaisediminis TaxID=604088 RepID=UPI0038B3A7B6
MALVDQRLEGVEFRLEELDSMARGGIAAAIAIGGTMVIPDSTVSFSLNASTYQGEQGFSGALSARLDERLYLSASIGGSTARDSTGARVGLAFGF